MEVDWSDLPEDLLFSIATRTKHLSDYIRFGAVCKSWRSAITGNPRPLHLGFPMLFVSLRTTANNNNNNNRPDHALYNPFERKLHPIRLPDRPRPQRCIGSSSNGWVCMIDDNLDLYLLNLFSTAVVPLPPFRNDFISEPIPRPYGSLVYFVWKAVWFAEPTDPNCIIALLYQWDYTRDMETGVVYYKWGDARWTVLETSLESVDNVVFFNENLYLVDRWGGVKEIDLHQGREITMETWLKGYKYLGAGPSGPLLVAKHMKACEVRPFELFELDRTLKKWVETKSLDEGMFFLGMNTLIWLSSSNLKGCKGNSIYFIYYNMNDRRKDLCIFNLEDGSFGTICGIDEKLLYNGYEWVVPIP